MIVFLSKYRKEMILELLSLLKLLKKMQDKINLIQEVQNIFDECNLKVSDNMIWVMRGSVVALRLDINTLMYFKETGGIEDYIKNELVKQTN